MGNRQTIVRQEVSEETSGDKELNPELFAEPKFVGTLNNSLSLSLPSLEWLKQTFKTKSGAIRYLAELGFKSKQIALHLNIRQQHARNVLSQELKRGPIDMLVNISPSQCSHEKTARAFVDVILRRSSKDMNQSRILYRVCSDCARNLIPGVTEEALKKHLPGVFNENDT